MTAPPPAAIGAGISAWCAVQTALSVMAGLVPAIHAAPFRANPKLFRRLDDVDDRDKPGHDGVWSFPPGVRAGAAAS